MRFSCLCVCARVACACHAKVEVATERKQGCRLVPRSPGGRSPSPPSSLPILHAGLLGLSFPA